MSAAAKVKYDVVPYTRGIVLDLGSGPERTYRHWITVDHDPAAQAQLTTDCARLSESIQPASVDAIFSADLLPEMDDYRAALQDWWGCLKPGGYLVLFLPHKDFTPSIANPLQQHAFFPLDILEALASFAHFDVVVNETRADDGGFLQVFRKNLAGDLSFGHTYNKRRPDKSACIVRYGGYGDLLQAANILPELQRQGYHVTLMTTPKGQNILQHDPHIDAWLLQDEDQVPNHELPDYWRVWRKKFTKFVNLCESVEGTLLAMPGRANHAWPDSVRRKRLGVNYLEFTAELAELPYRSDVKFYATAAETARAKALLDAHGGSDTFHMLWALSGSSIHKFYPHQDQVIARLLLNWPNVHLILTGDAACKILEAGWEGESRITLTSGELAMRDTLTLAQHVDCVVGPETGVLNAVAFERVAKVILLSHSSIENLCKHWQNASVLLPPKTPCYPCHRLHYGREFCWEHVESGAAMCQFNISPDTVTAAIAEHYAAWLAPDAKQVA
jgi:ADP-heptose:LPS heptosyltransferase